MLRDLIYLRNCSNWVQRWTWSSELGRRGRGTGSDRKRQLRQRDEVQSTGHGWWLQRTGHGSGHTMMTIVFSDCLKGGFMLPEQTNAKHLPGCPCYIVGRNITWHSMSNSVHGKPPAGLPEPREWQAIFTSYTSDKILMSKIYKELQILNAKEIKLPISK